MKNRKKQKQTAGLTVAPATDAQKCIDYLKLRYDFRYNTVRKTTEFRRKGEKQYKDLEDEDFRSIRTQISTDSNVNFKCSRETLKDIIYSNTTWRKFDPFKDWANRLPKWDGKDHIAELAATVHTDDDQYFCWCLRKWIVAFLVCLIIEKEVNQTCLFLCGKQGTGKSTWVYNLLPPELQDYYACGSINFKDKDSQIQLSELAIYNLDEGNSLKSKDIDNLKELVTLKKTKMRRAYAHKPSVFVRRASFVGTSNSTKILHDMTGNRRFLCQNVLSIDYQHKVDLKQVYAQALHIHRTGKFQGKEFHYWFDNKEQSRVEKKNQKFRNESQEEILIKECFEKGMKGENGTVLMDATTICSEIMIKYPAYKLSPQKIGTTLSQLGFNEQYQHGGFHKWIVKWKTPEAETNKEEKKIKARPSAE